MTNLFLSSRNNTSVQVLASRNHWVILPANKWRYPWQVKQSLILRAYVNMASRDPEQNCSVRFATYPPKVEHIDLLTDSCCRLLPTSDLHHRECACRWINAALNVVNHCLSADQSNQALVIIGRHCYCHAGCDHVRRPVMAYRESNNAVNRAWNAVAPPTRTRVTPNLLLP